MALRAQSPERDIGLADQVTGVLASLYVSGHRWAGVIQRHPVVAAAMSGAFILVLAAPALGMKLSFPDESAQARGTMGYASYATMEPWGHDRPQMSLAEDQHPVGDLGPGGEHEPFGIGVRPHRQRHPIQMTGTNVCG